MFRLKSLTLPAAVATALLTLVLTQCGQPEPGPADTPDISKLADGAAAHAHTAAILKFGPRPPGSASLRKTRGHLTTTLRESGWQVGSQKFTTNTPVGRQEFVNLIARFGQANDPDLWSRPVTGLLSCHIDSKLMPQIRFVGADDAASAAGLILEVARQLAESPEQAKQIEIVFFDGEEAFAPNMTPTDGLFGSREYAKRWIAAAKKPKFGLNLDMIGHRDLHIRYPSDSPARLVALLTNAATAENASERFYRASTPILDDHVPLNNAGIPTLDIIGDFSRGNWWHTERDSLRLLSEDSLNLSLRIVLHMLDELLPTPADSSQ